MVWVVKYCDICVILDAPVGYGCTSLCLIEKWEKLSRHHSFSLWLMFLKPSTWIITTITHEVQGLSEVVMLFSNTWFIIYSVFV